MSLKRSQAGGRTHFGGGADPGAKVGRQELYDELKRLAQANQFFAPVDVALAIGAGEPQVSRALLGLAAEGCLEKLEVGKYRVHPSFADLSMPEFLKAFSRASKPDSTRQRDLPQLGRLQQNHHLTRRRPGTELELPFPTVSALHARIFRHGAGWAVADLGSANGTFLGSTRLAPGDERPLRPGDTVRVAEVMVTFESEVRAVRPPGEDG